MRTFRSAEELTLAIGEVLGPSEWMTVTQPLIDAFAELTEDRQWIHIDETRAAESSFGGTVAHGYLLESLIPRFSAQLLKIEGFSAGINVGSDKVRFIQPVIAGSRIRARAQVLGIEARDNGVRIAIRFEYELEGVEKPAMIAETIRMLTP